MRKQKEISAWENLTEMTKKQYYYAGDPRVPEDYVPPGGKRVPKADTLEWMMREQKRLSDRLKILNFKINILTGSLQDIIKEYHFEPK